MGDESFNFEMPINYGHKDLTVVPEEAKFASSTCVNEPLDFLRIESIQENQLAAINAKHSRLSSLTDPEKLVPTSPERRMPRATTCFRELKKHED